MTGMVMAAIAAVGIGVVPAGAAGKSELLLFAAASLQDAIREVGAAYEASHPGTHLTYNFAGSQTLARQAVASRQADIFLSAAPEYVDGLEAKGVTITGTRVQLLRNQLVVIGSRKGPGSIDPLAQWCAKGPKCLVAGEPGSVPAGIYARRWMEGRVCGTASLWERVRTSVVPAKDVRQVLGTVRAKQGCFGIVYRTDLEAAADLQIVYSVPEKDAPPIRYDAVALAGRPSPEKAKALLDYLGGEEAWSVWRKHGFLRP